MEAQDYAVFLSYLKEYLLPKDEVGLRNRLADPATTYKEKEKILRALRLNNFADEIKLLAYCLMPNHFHFLVKQTSANSIDKFTNSLGTRYSIYFNKKYARVGSLYQGVYKAVLVKNDEQLIHLSRYIHKQALATKGQALRAWENQPCSFPEYVGERKTDWIHSEEVLSFFSKSSPTLSYRSFIEGALDLEKIQDILLEESEGF
ncbi:MAG TPA: transposase [Gammaproteobacteria bacterium]|nr:transposase [Gammaproteobacteria bacterium]